MPKKYNEEKSLLKQKDEELVLLIQNGDEDALAQLYLRYKGLLYKVSFDFMVDKNMAQMHFVYLYDIALDGLYVACREYRTDMGKPFINYWWAIVERRHMSYLQDVSEHRFEDIYGDIERKSDSQIVSEAVDIIKNHNSFSLDEKIYLTYSLLGFKPLEIAEFNDWNRAKLYRIKAKAMAKLNKIFKSN